MRACERRKRVSGKEKRGGDRLAARGDVADLSARSWWFPCSTDLDFNRSRTRGTYIYLRVKSKAKKARCAGRNAALSFRSFFKSDFLVVVGQNGLAHSFSKLSSQIDWSTTTTTTGEKMETTTTDPAAPRGGDNGDAAASASTPRPDAFSPSVSAAQRHLDAGQEALNNLDFGTAAACAAGALEAGGGKEYEARW